MIKEKYLLLTFILSLTIFASRAATVDTIQIFSNSMHKYVKCVVITPQQYSTDTAHFPVVYLLHGHGGSYADWVKKAPDLLQVIDEAGCIVVCPDGNVDSWYFDSPVDTAIKYETNVAKEIPAFIDAHYRTIADRNARAITGLSMGGHGALYLAFKHVDEFGAAGSMSGGVDFRPFPESWGIKDKLGDYKTHKETWDKNVVVTLANNIHNGEQALIVECGVDDFFIQVNRDLHQKLLERKIDHDYVERAGEHNWAYWNNSVKFQLLFFKNFFQQHTLMKN
jgi:S-formylglutathione hydrolase FrmB